MGVIIAVIIWPNGAVIVVIPERYPQQGAQSSRHTITAARVSAKGVRGATGYGGWLSPRERGLRGSSPRADRAADAGSGVPASAALTRSSPGRAPALHRGSGRLEQAGDGAEQPLGVELRESAGELQSARRLAAGCLAGCLKPVLRCAVSAERHDRQRGGFRDRAGGSYLHAVLAQPVGEAHAEWVRGEPAEEPRRLAEPGHRPGGIERTAARTGVDAAIRPDDQIDQALAGDQDHEAVPGPVVSVRSAPALPPPALPPPALPPPALPPPPPVAPPLLASAASSSVVAPVMIATASSIVWLCGVRTPAARPRRWIWIRSATSKTCGMLWLIRMTARPPLRSPLLTPITSPAPRPPSPPARPSPITA